MGWSRGSSLFSAIIRALKPAIPDEEQRKNVYRELVDAFRGRDWDTLSECLGEDPAYDAIYGEIYPEDEEVADEDD